VFLGLSKGGFSGIGMVAAPLLAIIMSPLEAAAILLPIILVQDVVSVWVYRRVWDPWNLKVMIPGCLIGVGAAWMLAAYVSDGMLRLVVGLIALGFVAYAFFRYMLPGEPPRPRASHGVFWGALSGFTTTLIQIGAPPYYAFVLPQRLEKMIYVGTTVMFFAAANTMKVVPYFALGQFSTAGLATSFALFPLATITGSAALAVVALGAGGAAALAIALGYIALGIALRIPGLMTFCERSGAGQNLLVSDQCSAIGFLASLWPQLVGVGLGIALARLITSRGTGVNSLQRIAGALAIALTIASDRFATAKWSTLGITNNRSLSALTVGDFEVVDYGTEVDYKADTDCIRNP